MQQPTDWGLDPKYYLPDALWDAAAPLLPAPRPKKKPGRPRMPDRQALTAIFYLLRTGCQWNALPRSLGADSTVHDRFQEWAAAGFFERLWVAGLLEYDERCGLEWEWQAMDGAMTKAPLGQAATGPNPTDRGKAGTKRSVLTEGHGLPVGVAVAGANRHDSKLVEATLQSIPIERPEPTAEQPQNMCLDAAYDGGPVAAILDAWGYTAHIRSRGAEKEAQQQIPGYRARRWVVERTHSWMNRFRRLLIRWEKKPAHYLALIHFACAFICFRAAGLFG